MTQRKPTARGRKSGKRLTALKTTLAALAMGVTVGTWGMLTSPNVHAMQAVVDEGGSQVAVTTPASPPAALATPITLATATAQPTTTATAQPTTTATTQPSATATAQPTATATAKPAATATAKPTTAPAPVARTRSSK